MVSLFHDDSVKHLVDGRPLGLGGNRELGTYKTAAMDSTMNDFFLQPHRVDTTAYRFTHVSVRLRSS